MGVQTLPSHVTLEPKKKEIAARGEHVYDAYARLIIYALHDRWAFLMDMKLIPWLVNRL